MSKRGADSWMSKSKIRYILFAFSAPKTPRQVERELHISKLKLKHFVDKGLLKSLNPNARKGKLYTLTDKSRKKLGFSFNKNLKTDWDLIGRVIASPKQRLVVLKSMDSAKRTSENIRERASRFNPHLSRISTKAILKELIKDHLIETEMQDGKRYYWINGEGSLILEDVLLITSNLSKN